MIMSISGRPPKKNSRRRSVQYKHRAIQRAHRVQSFAAFWPVLSGSTCEVRWKTHVPVKNYLWIHTGGASPCRRTSHISTFFLIFVLEKENARTCAGNWTQKAFLFRRVYCKVGEVEPNTSKIPQVTWSFPTEFNGSLSCVNIPT